MLDNPCESDRFTALKALALLHPNHLSEHCSKLVNMLRVQSCDVRCAALETLKKVLPDHLARHASELLTMLKDSSDSVRARAVKTLAGLPQEELAEHSSQLLTMLEDPSLDVCQAACDTLGKLSPVDFARLELPGKKDTTCLCGGGVDSDPFVKKTPLCPNFRGVVVQAESKNTIFCIDLVCFSFFWGEPERMTYLRSVKEALVRRSVPVYMVDVGPGESFAMPTMAGLFRTKMMAAFCTEDYGEETGARYETFHELRYAWEKNLRIVPVRLCTQYPPTPHGDAGKMQNDFVFSNTLLYIDGNAKSAEKVAQELAEVWHRYS